MSDARTPVGPYTVWVDHGCYEGWSCTDYPTLAEAIGHESYGSPKHISKPVVLVVRERVDADETSFKPDWKLSDAEATAVALSIALNKHVAGWSGATDEELAKVVDDALLRPNRLG